jgi:hypothetical protein
VRQADVTEADVINVISIAKTCLETQDACGFDELAGVPAWHLFEAEQYLITAACIYLSMPPPRAVTFSCLDSVEAACECEVQLFWVKNRRASLDPGKFVEGAISRMSEYRWAGADLAVKLDEHAKYVIWRVSLLKKAMDKEAPACISGK